MKIERTLSIMLFLCALDISVKAQSPTQNYVLSKDVLDVDGTHAITTVTYYDGLNRLEESTYAEGEDMNQNKNRYSENVLSYSANGSIERLQRYGKKNNGAFGLIDDLTYSYNGNQIKAISDKAGSLLYNGSFDFKDGANADVEYFYDANGALVKDLNKGISNIEYDVLGNLYGHAYFYELKQKNPSIEPSHTFGVVGYVKEFDPYFNQVVSYPAFGKNNTELEEQINIVEQQAIDNYEKNNR